MGEGRCGAQLRLVATLFCQCVAGYVGRNVNRRGKNADRVAVWSLVELQDLGDEWIVAHWPGLMKGCGIRSPWARR